MVMDRPIPGHITGLYLFTVFNLVAMLNVALVAGDVSVVDTKQNVTLTSYEDLEAGFGPRVPENGIEGRLVYVTPHNACTAVNGTPTIDPHMIKYPWIALVAREDCDFAFKVYNVEIKGYSAIIFFNRLPDEKYTLPKAGDGPDVEIPSVFVGYDNGMELFQQYSYNNTNVLIRIDSNESPIDFSLYLWPFAIVIGTCFCLMIVFMVVKWFRDLRSRQRSRLSKKHLKKIPVKKFKKGDYYDVCAICLDDYEEGEKLRVLPCSHAYHVKCIDPWLLKNKKTCPVCKRRVMPGQDADSDTDSDEDNGNSTSATESTPLLSEQTRGPSSRRSTFDTSGLPETVRQEALQGQSSSQSTQPADEDDESSSEEGAVGGVEHESIEVVVETESQANQNLAYSSDDDFLVASEKGKEKPKKLSQVV